MLIWNKRVNMQLTHQQEALDKTKNFDRVAYYLDMGFGKIFVGSEKMKSYGRNGGKDHEAKRRAETI